MTRFSILTGLLTAAALLSSACPTQAQERPFYADGDGVAINEPRLGQRFLHGEGEGTHLGRFRLFGSFDRRVLPPVSFTVRSMSLTAADGDVLNTVGADAAEFDPETGTLWGTIEFDGGTGRFADATGSASLLMQFDEQLASFTFALDGTIDY